MKKAFAVLALVAATGLVAACSSGRGSYTPPSTTYAAPAAPAPAYTQPMPAPSYTPPSAPAATSCGGCGGPGGCG